jgi:hypothetical protein
VGLANDTGDNNKGFPHMLRNMQNTLVEGCKTVCSMGDFQSQFFLLPVMPDVEKK